MRFYVLLGGCGSDTTALSTVVGVYSDVDAAHAAVSTIDRHHEEYRDFVRRWHAAEDKMEKGLVEQGKWKGWWGDHPEHAAAYEAMKGRKDWCGLSVLKIVALEIDKPVPEDFCADGEIWKINEEIWSNEN